MRSKLFILTVLYFLIPVMLYSQVKSVIDLRKGEYRVVNRKVSLMKEDKRDFVRVSEDPGNGLVILKYVNFSEGTIEFDMRVPNPYEKSMSGVLFHGINDSVYDVIWFNPFVFNSPDSTSKSLSIGYASMPKNPAQQLISDFPGKYHQALNQTLASNDWFHVKIESIGKNIKVFINGSADPTLEIVQINKINRGFTGIWVGSESGGDFSKFTYVSKK